MEELWQNVSNWLVTEGIKLVIAIIALFILFKVIKNYFCINVNFNA